MVVCGYGWFFGWLRMVVWVVEDGYGWLWVFLWVVVDGCGWLWVVVDGCGWCVGGCGGLHTLV